MNHLDQIENRIRLIIEKSSGLLPWTDQYAVLVRRLCESIQIFLLDKNNAFKSFPTGFRIYMHPEETQLWKQQFEWKKSLANTFVETVSEFGYKLDRTPDFSLISRNSLERNEILITAIENLSSHERTGAVVAPKTSQPIKTGNSNKHSAKLLFGNNELISLEKAVVNLGRRTTNDIVINDLRISRTHAQIRKAREGFMIFDVGSTGGTFINGERITNHLLRSGDVISLAGYTMIYTDENNHEMDNKRVSTSEISNNSGATE